MCQSSGLEECGLLVSVAIDGMWMSVCPMRRAMVVEASMMVNNGLQGVWVVMEVRKGGWMEKSSLALSACLSVC